MLVLYTMNVASLDNVIPVDIHKNTTNSENE